MNSMDKSIIESYMKSIASAKDSAAQFRLYGDEVSATLSERDVAMFEKMLATFLMNTDK